MDESMCEFEMRRALSHLARAHWHLRNATLSMGRGRRARVVGTKDMVRRVTGRIVRLLYPRLDTAKWDKMVRDILRT